MKSEISQLFDELRQICAQYAAEVPGKRRPWPESVRTRIFRLRFLGVSNARIAQEVGIPAMTLYCWKVPSQKEACALPPPAAEPDQEGGFVPVRVVRRKSGLPALGEPAPKSRGRPRSTTVTVKNAPVAGTLTVVTPEGLRLEGLTLDQAIAAARELSR
jgi:transposase-like protein